MNVSRILAVLTAINTAATRVGATWALCGAGLFKLLGVDVAVEHVEILADLKLDVPERVYRAAGCSTLGYWLNQCHVDWRMWHDPLEQTMLESSYIGKAGYPLVNVSLALVDKLHKDPKLVQQVCSASFADLKDIEKLSEEFWFL